MAAQLSSTSNKGFLWNLMVEADVFGGVPPNKKQYVIEIFEQVIKEVEYNNNSGSLIEMNKAVITLINNRLDPIREKQQKTTLESPKLVTAAEISANRQEQFANNLSQRQRQFDELMIHKKPEDVDFSDKNVEKPIGAEMDDMLAKMMARREKQLNQVMNQVMKSEDTNVAQNWINNDGNGSQSGPPTLQIGEIVSEPKVEVVKPKSKVTFVDDSLQHDNLQDINPQHDSLQDINPQHDSSQDDNILSLFKIKKKELDRDSLIEKVTQLESHVSELSNMIREIKLALQ